MADAAVEFLLDNLKQLLIHHAQLIKDAKGQVEQLEDNVGFFKSFLKKVSSKKLRKDETLKALVRDIRGVIYDADDIIDAFVTQAAEKKTMNYFSRMLNASGGLGLISIAEQVNAICTRISDIYGGKDKFDLVNLAAGDGPDEEALQPTPSRKDNVVGLKDEADKIVGYLNETTPHLDVISIIGMPGLGKTTLTGKIFHDSDIKYEFPTRIWVYVSQEFTVKEVFLSILRQMLTKLNEDEYSRKTAQQLAEEISGLLEGGKFLLVMDDVWEPTDWDKLKVCLPKHNPTGKVMITSRQVGVGRYANRFRDPHNLRSLNLDESCELLQWEVFSKPEFPSDLDAVGREIAGNCDGLPLAIVVIGGVLATKVSRSASAWEKVSSSVTTFLQLDPLNRMDRIISMSYEKLPYHLKECFLYLGMFPEDFEIPAWKLIRMWIAEGLIQPKDGLSMEEIAEYNLDDLINRNLVRVEKLKADGRVKSCRIHDMLRDFCRVEGGKDRENFLQEIKQSSDGGLQPSVTEAEKHRRLCIHSNVVNFLNRNPKGPYVRSFVTFSEDIEVPTENISSISAAFKLLRVLEAKPLKFSKIPSDFYHLVHLRYLALSLKMDSNSKASSLPKAFNKLWNIQTLIVDTTSRALDIKADVTSMTQLRHMKTNACTTLAKPGKDSKEGEKLQTLGTLSPESCTEAIFDRARNLKKLGIRGKLSSFLDGKSGSFDSLRKLSNLEKLKLLNDVFPKAALDGKLDGLPPAYKFPVKLRSLTLLNTFLDWEHMTVLGSLEKLKVLKLKDNAFVGSRWKVDDRGFDSLEVLHIGRTTLSIWVASALHFPSLKRLELHNCEKLKQIPIALADIPKLEYLDLQRCKEAAASARSLAAKKGAATFTLSIFPADDVKK
ncbi:probable disease resistance RPP8-like protein 2 [Salvia miltiorrhiza]|uniref:probable disease resistance RPP8-like protein 2 n=1 Tax=Salvia miltiorrhiza TaxID=226208 RepID=UPI0025ACC28A|nr:probable disease resistance RPP8-like protein 2 [Salvia miltiorrhiza]